MTPALADAVARHRTGDVSGALAAYQKLLPELPNNPELLHFLGMAQIQSGLVDKGLKHLKSAVTLEPESHLFQSNLGKAALRVGDTDVACVAFEAAVQLRANDFESWNNLGGLYRRAGDLAASYRAYETSLALKPHASVALNLGLVAQDRGLRDDAREAFTQAIKLRPEEVQARLQLAAIESEDGDFEASSNWLSEAERFAPKDPRVLAAVLTQRSYTPTQAQLDRAKSLLNDPRVKDPEKTRLGFGLGRALQRDGQHEAAWASCEAANAIVSRAAPFDSNRLAREVDRLKSVFNAELISRLGCAGEGGEQLVFIVGLPRSGTTLAEQILASHPNIYGADERPEIPALVSALGGMNGTYPESLRTLPPESLSEFAEKTVESYRALAPKAERIVDKLPFNFSNTGLIAAVFPAARIIHCVRDLRDVFVSCFFTEFTDEFQAFKTRPEHFSDYARHYRDLMDYWDRLFPGRIEALRYEEVVSDLEPSARKLVAAAGMDWHPNCLDYSATKRTVRTPSRWQVRQPIYSTSVGRWTHYEEFLGPVADLEA